MSIEWLMNEITIYSLNFSKLKSPVNVSVINIVFNIFVFTVFVRLAHSRKPKTNRNYVHYYITICLTQDCNYVNYVIYQSQYLVWKLIYWIYLLRRMGFCKITAEICKERQSTSDCCVHTTTDRPNCLIAWLIEIALAVLHRRIELLLYSTDVGGLPIEQQDIYRIWYSSEKKIE
jgi:hypothetical protein